jgi:hypothetical protein
MAKPSPVLLPLSSGLDAFLSGMLIKPTLTIKPPTTSNRSSPSGVHTPPLDSPLLTSASSGTSPLACQALPSPSPEQELREQLAAARPPYGGLGGQGAGTEGAPGSCAGGPGGQGCSRAAVQRALPSWPKAPCSSFGSKAGQR